MPEIDGARLIGDLRRSPNSASTAPACTACL